MHSYQFTFPTPPSGMNIVRRDDRANIPREPENRDYQQFLEDWKNGAEVLNADGAPAPYSEAGNQLAPQEAPPT
jgi:hypothetical protein